MAIQARWTRLGAWAMNNLPQGPGVYELANVTFQTIFFGSCEDLSLRLHQHLYTRDPCLSRAWHFRFEEHANAAARLRELVEEYQHEQGALPDCMKQ
ncbi:MAG: hypothetical protein HYY02_02225 [Chloroflexi bacterium]|nr:hypothetical protein [Chloroflexota bacterium]